MMQLLCNTPTKFKTSCPYYNVKLSLVFLKLPLLTYSDHKVTFFTNPKLTNIQWGDLETNIEPMITSSDPRVTYSDLQWP